MRVLIWATTLQADVLALAHGLEQQADCELMLAAEHPNTYHKEPIARYKPLACTIYDRSADGIRKRVEAFAPDVIVADNHIPTFPRGTRFCTMWHGLGWKARGQDDLSSFYKEVKRLTGVEPRQPNDRFLAQCYGESDTRWRIDSWRLDADSCKTIGMCFSDLLLKPPYSKNELQPYYDIDIVNRKVVLLSISWHYGRILAEHQDKRRIFSKHEGLLADMDFLAKTLACIEQAGAGCILCLHDRQRYEKEFLQTLYHTVRQFSDVQVKHKSRHPDNLADLCVADVMATNLSSFITYFYFFGRPSIHIVPVASQDESPSYAQLKNGKVSYRTVKAEEALWMNEPKDNGGLTARSFDELKAGIIRGLNKPECCAERSADWIARHVHQPDGKTAQRFFQVLRDFVGDC
ncbi:MAG: hypothetical protein GY854_11860 [Deltaproteobacteria bacterium]|nr:hypothetical protein [Deltaproteobacteria bacterium]